MVQGSGSRVLGAPVVRVAVLECLRVRRWEASTGRDNETKEYNMTSTGS